MLSLGRNHGEYIVIGGDIIVQLIESDGQVRLAVDAPAHIPIVRGEVYEQSHPAPDCIRRERERRASS